MEAGLGTGCGRAALLCLLAAAGQVTVLGAPRVPPGKVVQRGQQRAVGADVQDVAEPVELQSTPAARQRRAIAQSQSIAQQTLAQGPPASASGTDSERCPVRMEVGQLEHGARPVTVSVPAACDCDQLELAILVRRGLPCAADQRRCAWLTAHGATPLGGRVRFNVSVAGEYRPVARCAGGVPVYGSQQRLPGLDLASWNVRLWGQRYDDMAVVRVLEQTDDSGDGAFFPQLVVSLYWRPASGRQQLRTRRTATFSAQTGCEAKFYRLAADPGGRFVVDARPAGSWVCRGANDGCQRRGAALNYLDAISQHALDGAIAS